jgi:hypothetical protein
MAMLVGSSVAFLHGDVSVGGGKGVRSSGEGMLAGQRRAPPMIAGRKEASS